MKSRTYIGYNDMFGANIGNCQYFGNISSDYISIQGMNKTLTVRVNFTQAYYTTNCSNIRGDGYLSFDRHMFFANSSIIQMLKYSGQINNSIFALYINNITYNKEESYPSSALEIGGYNIHKYSSDPSMLVFIPLTNNSID